MITTAIVRPPAANFSEGLTTAALGVPDYHKAFRQHAAYCDALEQCGLKLIRLHADEQHPDSCFVEDAAIVFQPNNDRATATNSGQSPLAARGSVTPGNKQAVLTRPGALSRRGEIESLRDELTTFYRSIDEIRAPGTVDGGDVCEAGTQFFIGISERTNEEGARQLADILASYGYVCSLVDIRTLSHTHAASATSLLHLKSGLAYLGANTLVITEALANCKEFRTFNPIRIEPGEEYAANCINLNGKVLVAAGYQRFEAELNKSGYQTTALDMSEFQKMDGGLSCLSVRW